MKVNGQEVSVNRSRGPRSREGLWPLLTTTGIHRPLRPLTQTHPESPGLDRCLGGSICAPRRPERHERPVCDLVLPRPVDPSAPASGQRVEEAEVNARQSISHALTRSRPSALGARHRGLEGATICIKWSPTLWSAKRASGFEPR